MITLHMLVLTGMLTFHKESASVEQKFVTHKTEKTVMDIAFGNLAPCLSAAQSEAFKYIDKEIKAGRNPALSTTTRVLFTCD